MLIANIIIRTGRRATWCPRAPRWWLLQWRISEFKILCQGKGIFRTCRSIFISHS